MKMSKLGVGLMALLVVGLVSCGDDKEDTKPAFKEERQLLVARVVEGSRVEVGVMDQDADFDIDNNCIQMIRNVTEKETYDSLDFSGKACTASLMDPADVAFSIRIKSTGTDSWLLHSSNDENKIFGEYTKERAAGQTEYTLDSLCKHGSDGKYKDNCEVTTKDDLYHSLK